jgi:hypothetical protein
MAKNILGFPPLLFIVWYKKLTGLGQQGVYMLPVSTEAFTHLRLLSSRMEQI